VKLGGGRAKAEISRGLDMFFVEQKKMEVESGGGRSGGLAAGRATGSADEKPRAKHVLCRAYRDLNK